MCMPDIESEAFCGRKMFSTLHPRDQNTCALKEGSNPRNLGGFWILFLFVVKRTWTPMVQELLQMIKDVVILTGEPPVLTSQLGAESLESPDIFVTWTDGIVEMVKRAVKTMGKP